MTDHSELMQSPKRVALIAKMIAHHETWAVEMKECAPAEARFHKSALIMLRQLAERAGEASGVLEGWQLVPREPTHKMVEAGARSVQCDVSAAHKPQHRTARRAARNAFVTMLASAPTPDHSPNAGNMVPAPTHEAQQGVAADAADARRYRWLRDVSVPPHNFYISVPVEFADERYTPAQVDKAIDQAIAALTPQDNPSGGEA